MISDKLKKITRRIDRKIRRLLIKIMRFILGELKEKNVFEGEVKSIIIIAQEKLGDAILLTPLLRNLRRAMPRVKIHIVALSATYRFFRQDPNVDMVFNVKSDYFGYFQKIRTKKYDLLFNAKDHPSFTFLYQTRLINARHKVGIDHPYHKGFYNHLIKSDFHRHIIEKNCSLLDYLKITYTKEECRPYLPNDKSISEEIKKIISDIKDENPIGINLSAGEKDREWPLKKWRSLLAEMNRPVIIFALADRIKDKIKLESQFDHIIITPQTHSIFEAGQIIRYLKVLISPDTSLIHVASCFGTPVVGLYRAFSEHVNRFYPYLIPHKTLISPSHKIEDISVKQVINSLEELLKSTDVPVSTNHH